jgi:hypothetical protein
MGDDSIELDGNTYIPSARAARLVGYTKDYVGQLARAGKLDAKLVGRSWYINEDSIRKHKLSVHYTLTKPKKSQQIASRETEIPSPSIENSSYVHSPADPTSQHNTTVVDVANPAHYTPHVDADAILNKSVVPRREKRDGSNVLVHTDIRYEPGQPIFFDDDRPALPEPTRPARFEGVPLPTPRTDRGVRVAQRNDFRPQRVKTFRQQPRSAVTVDGVRMSPQTTTVDRQSVPRERQVAVDVAGERERPRRRSLRVGRTSKAIPIFGALILFVLFALWYIFVR